MLGSGVSPARLLALAQGLSVSVDELFAVASGRRLTEPEAKLVQVMVFFNSLPVEKQEEALEFLRMYHRRYGTKTETIAAAKKRLKSRRAA